MSKNKKNNHKQNNNTSNEQEYIKDTSPIVYQKGKLKSELHIRVRPDLTNKQKELLKLISDKESRLIFILGPAGCSKTFIAITAALQLLNDKKISDIIYIRSLIESADRSMGYLKGSESEKLHPYTLPLMDKLDELLPRNEVDLLLKEERVTGQPVNFLRGQNFNAKCIIADEVQNFSFAEVVTTITRIGQFTKMICCADQMQSDIGNKSGISAMIRAFDDEDSRLHGIHFFRFTEDDIVRSDIVRFIVSKLNSKK
jgi:phosphate starvation-inducible protein PhoH